MVKAISMGAKELLDKDKDGALSQKEARTWLRSGGAKVASDSSLVTWSQSGTAPSLP